MNSEKKKRLFVSAKSTGQDYPAQSAQADLSRNHFALGHFLHVTCMPFPLHSLTKLIKANPSMSLT